MLVESLKNTWWFFKRNFFPIATIVLPVAISVEAIALICNYFFFNGESERYGNAIRIFVGFFINLFYQICIVFYVSSKISGHSMQPQNLWYLAIKYWWPFLLLNLCIDIAVLAGLMLLIIPGLIISARLAFAPFELLLNQCGVIESMKISWKKTEQYFTVIFLGWLVIFIISYIPYYVLTALVDKSSGLYSVLDFLSNIIYPLVSTLYVIFSFRIYDFYKLQNSVDSIE